MRGKEGCGVPVVMLTRGESGRRSWWRVEVRVRVRRLEERGDIVSLSW